MANVTIPNLTSATTIAPSTDLMVLEQTAGTRKATLSQIFTSSATSGSGLGITSGGVYAIKSGLDSDISDINTLLGNTSIASIGDGTVTGAVSQINSDLSHTYFQLTSPGSSVNIEQQDCWCQGNRIHIAFSATSNADMPSDYIWGIVPNEYRATSTIGCGFVFIENIANTYINSVRIENNGYIHQALVSSVPANTRVTFVADYFI